MGNGRGTGIGALRLKTNKGQYFFPMMTETPLGREIIMNVASGILLEVHGSSGNDIELLGPMFLGRIKIPDMIDVNYERNVSSFTPPRKKSEPSLWRILQT